MEALILSDLPIPLIMRRFSIKVFVRGYKNETQIYQNQETIISL
jgi:hypothetical protein